MVHSIEKSLYVYCKLLSQRKEMLYAALDNLEKVIILNTIVDSKKNNGI
jgi:hypothetical protein